MPGQYQECVEYLLKEDLPAEEPMSIFSQGLGEDDPIGLTRREVEEFEVQHFY